VVQSGGLLTRATQVRILPGASVAELIWSIIAVIASLGVCGVVVYYLITGRSDRDREEAAREYFDEHGHWPDEAPSG
jgi:hypothetical protein